jgi:hypothetical protein
MPKALSLDHSKVKVNMKKMVPVIYVGGFKTSEITKACFA